MKNRKIVKCDFVLKAKYNGIQLGTNGQPIRNGEMNNKIARELLLKHPAGALLFDKMPEGEPTEVKEIEVEVEVVKPKRKARRNKK